MLIECWGDFSSAWAHTLTWIKFQRAIYWIFGPEKQFAEGKNARTHNIREIKSKKNCTWWKLYTPETYQWHFVAVEWSLIRNSLRFVGIETRLPALPSKSNIYHYWKSFQRKVFLYRKFSNLAINYFESNKVRESRNR